MKCEYLKEKGKYLEEKGLSYVEKVVARKGNLINNYFQKQTMNLPIEKTGVRTHNDFPSLIFYVFSEHILIFNDARTIQNIEVQN